MSQLDSCLNEQVQSLKEHYETKIFVMKENLSDKEKQLTQQLKSL
jgi:DNA repair exonuclease SbcCD ATPase subunit